MPKNGLLGVNYWDYYGNKYLKPVEVKRLDPALIKITGWCR